MGAAYAQYLLPGPLAIERLGDALPLSYSIVSDGRRNGARTFYDTFDGRLRLAGFSLVHENGTLVLLEGGTERARIGWPMAPARVFAGDLPDVSLRRLVLPLIEVRALTRIAQVNSRRRLLRVLDKHEKTVVRLVVEEARVTAGRSGRLQPRLDVLGVRGYEKALGRICDSLESGLGTVAAGASLVDEVVLRAGGMPGGISSKPDVAIRSDERAGAALARMLQRLLDVIELNAPGAIADTDSEFLHDLRVALRRSRSLQRELHTVFPPAPLERFRAQFRWLQALTGPSRDLDVYLLEFDDFCATLPQRRQELEPLRALLEQRRDLERRRLVRGLRSRRVSLLLSDWGEFLTRVETGEAGGPDASSAIGQLAGARIARVYRKMASAGAAIDDASPAEALHELRKTGKELRYLLESFQGLYPESAIKPMVRTLKALQDTLGRFQDRHVQAELVRSLGADVRKLDDGPGSLMAMGQLIDRLEEQQRGARAEFAERFAAFASRHQRELVRETFR